MSEEQIAAKGRRAEQLLGDPVMAEAFQKIENDCVNRWRTAGDAAQREQQWMLLTALEEVKRMLRSFADNGHMADLQLKRRKGQSANGGRQHLG